MEAEMGCSESETLQARLDVLELMVSELARALPAVRAVTVSQSLLKRLRKHPQLAVLSSDGDEAASVSIAVLLNALDEQRERARRDEGQAGLHRMRFSRRAECLNE
jgi:hypothetical protein